MFTLFGKPETIQRGSAFAPPLLSSTCDTSIITEQPKRAAIICAGTARLAALKALVRNVPELDGRVKPNVEMCINNVAPRGGMPFSDRARRVRFQRRFLHQGRGEGFLFKLVIATGTGDRYTIVDRASSSSDAGTRRGEIDR